MPDLPPLSHDKANAHYAWRKRVNKHLPRIATRVFTLRDKMYRGCGFHHELECRLGAVIQRMNNYGAPLTIMDEINDYLSLKLLLSSLVRAEFSARGHDFSDRRLLNV